MADDQPQLGKPPCHRADALAVLRRLRENGHIAYFAGGCVRDLLLGLEPKDYDVATDAPPPRVRQLFTHTQAVGQAFGVILVRHGQSTVEVATFRSDAAYKDGRRPTSVTFTTPKEDAQRRDFTINGLFLDPAESASPRLPSPGTPGEGQGEGLSLHTTRHGTILDYVGGVADLNSRTLRAIGNPNDRFAEDHLRLLRAIRFAARFNLTIDPATESAIAASASKLKGISPERIADELRLMLTPPSRVHAWHYLRSGLDQVIFRFLPLSGGEIPWPNSLFNLLTPGQSITFGLALAAACLSILAPSHFQTDFRPLLGRAAVQSMIHAMRKALKISNEESDEMQGTLEGMAPLLADPPPTVATKKRFLARPTSRQSRLLLDALAHFDVHAQRINALRLEFAELEKTNFAPPPLITGDDLTAAGLTPGPLFKRILDAVYDAQLEDRIQSKEKAMRLALSLAAHNS